MELADASWHCGSSAKPLSFDKILLLATKDVVATKLMSTEIAHLVF